MVPKHFQGHADSEYVWHVVDCKGAKFVGYKQTPDFTY